MSDSEPYNSDNSVDYSYDTQSEVNDSNDDYEDMSHIEIDPDNEEVDENEDGQFDPTTEGEDITDSEEDIENSYDGVESDTSNDEQITTPKKYRKCKEATCNTPACDANINYGDLNWTRVPDDERSTNAVLTKYETIRVLGTRIQQLSMGAPPLIANSDDLSYHQIAYLELNTGMMPYIIRRRLPYKRYEEWKINELEIIHTIDDSIYNVDIDPDTIATVDTIKKTKADKKKTDKKKTKTKTKTNKRTKA